MENSWTGLDRVFLVAQSANKGAFSLVLPTPGTPVVMTLNMEMGLITPPVGLNLYVVQGVRGRGRIADVIVGATPFVVTLFAMIALLCLFPGLALWIPRSAMR